MRRVLGILAMLLLGAPLAARAQEQAAAEPPDRGQQVFDKMIEALGGEKYLTLTGMLREGRIYDFDSGVLAGSGTRFKDYLKFPDREWLEFGKKGNIVYLYSGEQGWELDKQGITEATPESLKGWQEGNNKDPEYLFRFRVREEELPIYYNGKEFVDNRMVHILEILDSDNESVMVYVDSRSYLPVQLRYSRHDELRRGRVPIVEYYGKYIDVGGVQVPFHFTRERDGQRVMEVFFKEVTLDDETPDGFFTLENLEARWKKVKK